MKFTELKYYLKKLEVSITKNENIFGDTLILSGPGGGKTTTIINRIETLIKNKINPNNILVLTHSKKSLIYIKNRINSSVAVFTFHSFTFNFLKNNFFYFKLFLDNEKKLIENYLFHEGFLWFSKEFFHYKNLLSFNEIILKFISIIEKDPSLRSEITKKYPFILVDDYQDCDNLSISFLKLLNLSGCNITLAGDDSQCVYSFMGSSHKNILFYKRDFPHGKIIFSNKNYRSTSRILDFTNAIFYLMKEKINKKIITSNTLGEKPNIIIVDSLYDQGEYLCILLKKLLRNKSPHESIAVLYKNKNLLEDIKERLDFHNIPYDFYSNSISEDEETLKEFITLKNFLKRVSYENLETLRSLIPENATESSIKSSFIINTILAIKNNKSYNFENTNLGRYFSLINTFFSRDYLAFENIISLYSIFFWDRLNLNERINIIKHHKNSINSNFKFIKNFKLENNNNNIHLLTIHSSKGLEWDHVFLTSATNGVYPNFNNNIEEELRIFYVGCSRARVNLTIISPLNIHWTHDDFFGLSPFITNLDKNLYNLINKSKISQFF